MSEAPQETRELFVSSIAGFRTGKPLVELRSGDWSLQLDLDQARCVAMNILAAAEAAEQDAFTFEIATRLAGMEQDGINLLREYRRWIDEQREKDSRQEQPKREHP